VALAGVGADVAVRGHDRTALDAAVGDMQSRGRIAIPVQADVRERAGLSAPLQNRFRLADQA
jgi:hypothetical protein